MSHAGRLPSGGAVIGVYAADSADLPLEQWADITSSACDASGIAVGPNNTLYVSSFFVSLNLLCLYDATTLESKGTLTLSTPIPRIQGISFDPASQRFAVTADNWARTVGYIYFVSSDGQVISPAYTVPGTVVELEGLDFTQGYIGYVTQPFDYVYFAYPIQLTGAAASTKSRRFWSMALRNKRHTKMLKCWTRLYPRRRCMVLARFRSWSETPLRAAALHELRPLARRRSERGNRTHGEENAALWQGLPG